jgi:hypothetical protein
MTADAAAVSLLVFEAADCLMAVPASEVAFLEKIGRDTVAEDPGEGSSRPLVDLGEYFGGRQSEGPWLRWGRGGLSAWLRVRRVVDVVPVALSVLTPMPTMLRRQQRTRAFLAAGVRGGDVFLLLDPARLTP